MCQVLVRFIVCFLNILLFLMLIGIAIEFDARISVGFNTHHHLQRRLSVFDINDLREQAKIFISNITVFGTSYRVEISMQ